MNCSTARTDEEEEEEEEVTGPGGLLSKFTKRLVEQVMEVELTDISAMSRISRPA